MIGGLFCFGYFDESFSLFYVTFCVLFPIGIPNGIGNGIGVLEEEFLSS